MNLLNKLTIKNLKLNKKRTVVTIIGIMLSVALITAVASIYASGIKSLINYETQIKGNFHTVFYNVPVSDMDKFENNRNIETLNITKGIGYAKVDSKNEDKPYAYIKGFTKESLNNLSIRLVSGRLPENDNEIVIPTHLKTNGRLNLKVNDTITLEVGKRIDSTGYELDQNNPYQKYDSEGNGESLIETKVKTYKIVGIIERPATNIENYSAPGYTFITYVDYKKMSGNVDVYARFTKDGTKNWYETIANILGVDPVLFKKVYNQEELSKEESDEFVKQMENTYLIDANKYLIDLETNPLSASSISSLGTVVCIVIGIIVFTSVFCIKNSFDISITEKIKQYGMLRSIGATKKQIKRNVFYEATILGTIGIPLGIVLGILASIILVFISNYFLGDAIARGLKLEFAFSYLAIIIAVVLGIVTIYFSAFKSAIRASKVSPIDSIRNSGDIKIKSKNFRTSKIIKKLFGIGGEISYKNLKRNKKKYRTTAISIVVSVFIFVALSSFMSMAFESVENELKIADYNISISTHDFDENSYKKFIETTQLDNIENYTILRQTGFEMKNSNLKFNKELIEFLNLSNTEAEQNNCLSINVLGKEQYNKYIANLGLKYDEIKDKAILFNYRMANKYDEEKNKQIYKNMKVFDCSVGDKIIGFVGNDENKTYEFEIGAISSEIPFGHQDYYEEKLILSDELFDKIASTRAVQIYYKSSNADKLQDNIDELLKGENYNLNNIDEDVRTMNNLFKLIGIFLYGFIIVISLIGITNIFNTITTNMELRKQEFAMLKSVGMTTKEFNRMIRLESLFMGVKSLFFGIPIGVALSYVIYHFLSEESGIPYKLPIVAIIISIVVVFILISVIMKYSMNKINKQNTIETIRNENI